VTHEIDKVTYAQWQQAWADTLGVNLVGAANVTWCAVRHMPRDGSARIVNVGSRGAFRGEPKCPAYGASRAALAAFGQSLAKALGSSGVAVTTVARASWRPPWRRRPSRRGRGNPPSGEPTQPRGVAF